MLTVLAVGSASISSFAMRTFRLVHPENKQKTVTIISDVHIEGDNHSLVRKIDEHQVRDLTEHLAAKKDCVAIIEDCCNTIKEREDYNTRFLPGTSCILQKYGINAHAVDFRKNAIYHNLNSVNTNNVISEEAILMNTYQRIEDQIPDQHQEYFKELKKEIGVLTSTFTSISSQDAFEETDMKREWAYKALDLAHRLFDFVLLAEINKHITENDTIYICTGHYHAKVLEKALKTAGFSRTAKTLSSSESMNLRDIQSMTNVKQQRNTNPYLPIDLKTALENMDKDISEYSPYPIDTASVA